MSFTDEEKNLILVHGASRGLCGLPEDDESEWRELAELMGRENWQEIRDAYGQLLDNDVTEDKGGSATDSQKENVEQQLPAGPNDDEDVDDDYVLKDLDECDCETIQVENPDNFDCNNEMNFIEINGELFEAHDLNQFLYKDTETLTSVNYDDQALARVSKKRLNNEDLDAKLIETMINQSEEELDFRRQEHEKKMKIYTMHLENGKAMHEEKMKILQARLKVVQEKIYHIDYAICNKNLHKKFKSGPI